MDLDVKDAIIIELIKIIEENCGDQDLCSIVGSYGDSLTDEEVLEHLEGYNE